MKQHTKRTMAIVTGASSGIGEALASAMAAPGTHVVLVARSVERLSALATRIESARFGFYGPFETEAPAHLSEILQVNVVALT